MSEYKPEDTGPVGERRRGLPAVPPARTRPPAGQQQYHPTTEIDLSRITVDSYLVAAIADHITPWTSAYRTASLLGSGPRFVLSNSGHIAAMVNPKRTTAVRLK